MEKIYVTKPSMPSLNEYLEQIEVIFQNKILTNDGVLHEKLQNELADYLNVNDITLFSNGHNALESIIKILDLSGEVITTPFTFISTTHAIVRNGLKPVFCDINEKDYTIDTSKIESLITDKTSAILPVHVYGNPCDVEAIERIAKNYNLKVIYDAAHAFGITYKGKSIANFGDASMFSFHATKVFNTIEGGCLAYNDGGLTEKLNAYKNFGLTGPETVEYIGTNSKMNEFQAAMGLCNIKTINEEIGKRKMVYYKYIENLNGVEGIKLSIPSDSIQTNYAYFPVVFDGFKKTRDEVYEELQANGVFARKYFYPITSQFECYKGLFDENTTPVAKYVSERVLTLPLYADLDLKDVHRICKIINR